MDKLFVIICAGMVIAVTLPFVIHAYQCRRRGIKWDEWNEYERRRKN